MSSDSSSKIRPSGPFWPLPTILKVKATRVRYAAPREFVFGQRVVSMDTAIEVDVTADSDFPARALAPVLHVGDRVLTEFKRVGEGQYKYFSVEDEELPEGAPVWWTWGGTGEPSGPRLQLEQAPPTEQTRRGRRPRRSS